jgi:hypothetical protein
MASTIQKYNTDIHFQPRVVVSILGVDVTDQVKGNLPTITHRVDDRNFSEFTSGSITFQLENTKGQWSTLNPSNFFVQNAHDQTGYQAGVTVRLGYADEDGSEILQTVFEGKVGNIDEQHRPIVTVTALDNSLPARNGELKNFGVAISSETLGNANYSASIPRFDFDSTRTPISKGSVSGTIDGQAFIVVDAIRKEGDLDYLNVEINYDAGTLDCEAEPPTTSSAVVVVSYKTAFGYKRPDTLAKEVGDSLGITVARERLSLSHWDKIAGNEAISTHGRPYWEADNVAVTRWFKLDEPNDVLYFVTDNDLVKYDFATDAYSLVATTPAAGYAFLSFDTTDFTDFYCVVTDHKEGDSTAISQSTRIYQWDGFSWTERVGDSEHLQCAYNYDFGSGGGHLIAENRFSNGVIHSGYLYFKFAEPSGDSTPHAGVKRMNLSGHAISIVVEWQYQGVGVEKVGVQYALDFCIDDDKSDVIVAIGHNPPTSSQDGTLEVWEMDLDGTSIFQRHTQDFTDGIGMLAISDMIYDGDDRCYFVVARGDVGDGTFGIVKLYKYLTASPYTVTELDSESRVTRGWRSPMVFNKPVGGSADAVIYLQGTVWDSHAGTYPNKTQAGRMIQVTDDNIEDLGFNWESESNASNQGAHTGFVSNSFAYGDNLCFVSGYATLGAIDTATRTTPHAPNTSPVNKRNNYTWIQALGFDLASKVETFYSNDAEPWERLTALAKIAFYELSFLPSGRLSFVPRRFTETTITSTIPGTGAVTTIDLADGSDFPDSTALNGEFGYVWIDGSELFRYTDKPTPTSNQLNGVTRGQDLTEIGPHSIGARAVLINHRAYNHGRLDNILSINVKPGFRDIRNRIHVPFGGNIADVDASVVGDTTTPSSETRFGVKDDTLSNDLLGSHDRPWAILTGRDAYNLFAFNKARGKLALRYMPDILPGNSILIDHPERVYLVFVLARVLNVQHHLERMETTIDFRAD